MSNSQLNMLKSAIKNRTEVTLNLSSNLVGNSNDETNFPQKLLLTDTQVSKIRKAFGNGSSANTKFSKTHFSKMIQSGRILDELLVFYTISNFSSKKRSIKKGISLAPKLAPKLAEKATEYYINKGINEINKKFTSSKCSWITLIDIEIKDTKVIKSLKNRGILLKETTR